MHESRGVLEPSFCHRMHSSSDAGLSLQKRVQYRAIAYHRYHGTERELNRTKNSLVIGTGRGCVRSGTVQLTSGRYLVS